MRKATSSFQRKGGQGQSDCEYKHKWKLYLACAQGQKAVDDLGDLNSLSQKVRNLVRMSHAYMVYHVKPDRRGEPFLQFNTLQKNDL
jgi:hypothetical protein